jgi:hypothetical protein
MNDHETWLQTRSKAYGVDEFTEAPTP